MVRGGRAEAQALPRSDVSFRLDQKTGNLKVDFPGCDGNPMQWSVSTEEKQKNELARAEFGFIKTTIII